MNQRFFGRHGAAAFVVAAFVVAAFVVAAFVVAAAGLLPAAAVYAQQTVTVGSLNLSPGAEIDFRLFGAGGGQSDRINVTGQFSSSAPTGTFLVGFGSGDNVVLMPGTTFTLVTFNSTNFTAADSTRFQAVPRDGFSSVNGTFLVNAVGGGPGSLQWTLTDAASTPEPDALALMVSAGLLLMGAMRFGWRQTGPNGPMQRQ